MSRRKEIKTTTEINTLKGRKSMKKTSEIILKWWIKLTSHWLNHEKSTQKERTCDYYKKPRGGITTDPVDIKRIMKECYKQF